LSSQWSLPFWLSHQYPICIPLLPHSCYMCRQSHPSWLDYFNYTWRRIQVMKLSPTSCHFIRLWSKYSPQQPFIKHPQSVFLWLCTVYVI
jgi:hypothetical protein